MGNVANRSAARNGLTEGVIWKEMILFFFPIVIGTLFQQLYNTVDAIVVGRFVGKVALASVGGSAAVITYQLIMFFTRISNGATVLIAQAYGAKDEKMVEDCLHTAIAFSLIAGAVTTVLGILLTPAMLHMMGTKGEVLQSATVYLRVFFAGITVTLLYNMGSGIMRAVGDSKRPLYYLIVCSISNIGLDVLFVCVFHMGIAGAALATILAQAVSVVLIIRSLMHSYDILRLDFRKIGIKGKVLIQQLKIGIPGGIQCLVYGFTNVIIQISVNLFSTDTIAAWAAYGKVDVLFWAITNAFGMTASTFAGQNLGAGKKDRIVKSTRWALFMSLVLNSIVLGLMIAFATPVMSLFTSDDNVTRIGAYMITYLVPSYIIFVFIDIFSGTLQGLGDVLIPTMIVMGGVMLVRLPWLLVMVPRWNNLESILLSYPMGWISTVICIIPYYLYRKKKLGLMER